MTKPRMRVDIWLWRARFFISRTVAGKACHAGKIYVNNQRISKAHILVEPGDLLTFTKGDLIKIVKITALGHRRGPAPEAQALYEDLSPPPPIKTAQVASPAQRDPGQGRPTKAERRAIDKLKAFD